VRLADDPTKKTKENSVIYAVLAADPTGCVNVSLWDTHGEILQPGDIVRLIGGYVFARVVLPRLAWKCERRRYTSLYKDQLVLYVGKQGTIRKIGEFQMVFNEQNNMSAVKWQADAGEEAKNLLLSLGMLGMLGAVWIVVGSLCNLSDRALSREATVRTRNRRDGRDCIGSLHAYRPSEGCSVATSQ
jgi:hypothetical protein